MEDSFRILVNEAKEDMKTLYLDTSDTRPWAVAWSGGKDSTCVMGLVVSMLEEMQPELRTRKIIATMSDTAMENPNLELYMHDQLDKLNIYAESKGLPIEARLVMRELKHSYFYLLLGKGYFLPLNNGTGRWCTQRLKLLPQKKVHKEINPSYVLVGMRSSESELRKRTIENTVIDRDISYRIAENKTLPTAKVFMPIVDFTIEDVWRYLAIDRLPWSSTHSVRKLYKEATGECGFTNPKETEKKAAKSESCGARFGCWTCPVVLNDRSTEQMSITNKWMEPLSKWRMLQIKVFGDYKPKRPRGIKRAEWKPIMERVKEINYNIKLITKSGDRRSKKKVNENLRPDQGTFTVEGREYLFNQLLVAQNEVNKLRTEQNLQPLELIKSEEIEIIVQRWEADRKESPHLVTNKNNIPIQNLDIYLSELVSIDKYLYDTYGKVS